MGLARSSGGSGLDRDAGRRSPAEYDAVAGSVRGAARSRSSAPDPAVAAGFLSIELDARTGVRTLVQTRSCGCGKSRGSDGDGWLPRASAAVGGGELGGARSSGRGEVGGVV